MSDGDVPVGTRGTVLMVFSDVDPPFYEVEFMDQDGESFGTYTVAEVDLRRVWRDPNGG